MKPIYTQGAPNPVGPYSQAIVSGNFLFLSGQIGIDPQTGKLKDTFEEQVIQIFKNVDEILKCAGATRQNVVKVVVYMTDLSLFPLLNGLYEDFFRDVDVKPARTTIGVSTLPLGAYVEIDITAVLGQEKV